MIKDEEYLKSKASFCLDLAKKLGATDASVTVGNSISETVSFRNKVLDESNRSDSLAISIETYLGKKKSSITSSNLLDENLKTLIEKCFETTKITPEDEFNSLPDKDLLAKNIKDLNLYDQAHIENDKKIDYLKELEETASTDKKIINTESSFTENKSNFILANSDGFCNGYKSSSFTASCVAVAKNENSMERDYEFTSKCHLNDISNPSELGKNAADQTIKKLNPKKIGSDKLSVIFDKRISKGFLSSFAGAISASSIARGTSFLKDKLNQPIFSNLILDAQEAMPDGGALTISTKLLNKLYIEIKITDTGCGIPAEILNKIFDPFFTTKGEDKGTGMGLFTVYNIIKAYGGTITVKSNLGKGTTFTIKLPIN